MTTRFPHLRAAIVRTPWAILPDRLEAIAEVIERRFDGVRLSEEEIAAIKGERDPNGSVSHYALDVAGNMGLLAQTEYLAARGQSQEDQGTVIAVINVMGVIAQHAHQVDNISGPGGTSCERVTNSFRAAMADPAVKAIVLNVDSPGGNVHGVQALANEIFKARGRKPIVAQVNSTMASAAYWLGAAADEIVMSPGAVAGSIGVYALHKDVSVAAEQEGVKFTFVSAGKFKVEGNQFEPLGDEARAAVQGTVDAYYADFTADVARFRGVKVADVRGGFGEGRMEKDRNAVKAGMADSIATMDETLRRLASAKSSTGTRADLSELAAEPQAITIEQRAAGDGGFFLYASEDFPACTAIDEAVLAEDMVAVDGDQVTLTFANGHAVYTMRPWPAKGARVMDLQSREWSAPPALPSAPDAAAVAAAETAERDAFRRRRHAHRQRTA